MKLFMITERKKLVNRGIYKHIVLKKKSHSRCKCLRFQNICFPEYIKEESRKLNAIIERQKMWNAENEFHTYGINEKTII